MEKPLWRSLMGKPEKKKKKKAISAASMFSNEEHAQ